MAAVQVSLGQRERRAPGAADLVRAASPHSHCPQDQRSRAGRTSRSARARADSLALPQARWVRISGGSSPSCPSQDWQQEAYAVAPAGLHRLHALGFVRRPLAPQRAGGRLGL